MVIEKLTVHKCVENELPVLLDKVVDVAKNAAKGESASMNTELRRRYIPHLEYFFRIVLFE